jgi:hypothetical protein
MEVAVSISKNITVGSPAGLQQGKAPVVLGRRGEARMQILTPEILFLHCLSLKKVLGPQTVTNHI